MLSQDLRGMPEVWLENSVLHKFKRANWFARPGNELTMSRNDHDDDDDDPDEDGEDESNKSTSSAPGRFHLPSLFSGRIMPSPILRRPHSNDELSAVGNEASFGNDGKDSSCPVAPLDSICYTRPPIVFSATLVS
jgi:hypothetical protein